MDANQPSAREDTDGNYTKMLRALSWDKYWQRAPHETPTVRPPAPYHVI